MAGDGLKRLFDKIKGKIDALHASRRNSEDKLNEKKSRYNDKKARFLEFIAEIIIILGLVEGFIREVNNFLAKGKKYEPKLKKILIGCFETNIACNLEDTIQPNQVYPIAPYFTLNVAKLDFFGLLKIDPNSRSGTIFYGLPSDNTLNRAIKTAIDSGSVQNWDNILWVKYDPNTNYAEFYVNNSYANKPVSSLITDIVNRINLIPNFSMLLNLFDNLYGSFSVSIQPQRIDPRSLINKEILQKYIEKILDGGEDLVIDDSFFNFKNEELFDIEKKTQNLSNNFLEILSCNNAVSVVKPEDLYPILDQIINAGTFNEQIKVIEAGMTTLQLVASQNVTRVDFPKFQIEFYFNIFNQLTTTLTGFVYSPQFLVIMMIYFRLANTNPTSPEPIVYADFVDFIKKTRNILICIVWNIFKFLFLLIVIPIIIKQLIFDVNDEKDKRNREKYELYYAQYLTLKGVYNAVKSTKLLSEIATSV